MPGPLCISHAAPAAATPLSRIGPSIQASVAVATGCGPKDCGRSGASRVFAERGTYGFLTQAGARETPAEREVWLGSGTGPFRRGSVTKAPERIYASLTILSGSKNRQRFVSKFFVADQQHT